MNYNLEISDSNLGSDWNFRGEKRVGGAKLLKTTGNLAVKK